MKIFLKLRFENKKVEKETFLNFEKRRNIGQYLELFIFWKWKFWICLIFRALNLCHLFIISSGLNKIGGNLVIKEHFKPISCFISLRMFHRKYIYWFIELNSLTKVSLISFRRSLKELN